MANHNYFDTDKFEREMRQAMADAPRQKDQLPAMDAHMRGREITLQSVLYTMREANLGTPANVIADGFCNIIAECIWNFAGNMALEDRMGVQIELINVIASKVLNGPTVLSELHMDGETKQ